MLPAASLAPFATASVTSISTLASIVTTVSAVASLLAAYAVGAVFGGCKLRREVFFAIDFASANPHFHTEQAHFRQRFAEGIVNVCTEGM
jgi:hypothetical protein